MLSNKQVKYAVKCIWNCKVNWNKWLTNKKIIINCKNSETCDLGDSLVGKVLDAQKWKSELGSPVPT